MSKNRWALHIAGVDASRGSVNVVADATLSPAAARTYARRILAAAEDAERQPTFTATTIAA